MEYNSILDVATEYDRDFSESLESSFNAGNFRLPERAEMSFRAKILESS